MGKSLAFRPIQNIFNGRTSTSTMEKKEHSLGSHPTIPTNIPISPFILTNYSATPHSAGTCFFARYCDVPGIKR